MSTRIEELSGQLAELKDKALTVAKRHLNPEGDRFSTEDAEDVVLDAYERAYAWLSQFRGDAKLSTWFYRIVINLCIDARRYASRHPVFSIDEPIHVDGDDIAADIPDPRCEPQHERVEKGEEQRLWHRLVGKLNPKRREVINLWFYEGLPYEEIAEYLGVPVGTVKSRLFNAKVTLRQLALEEGYPDFNVEKTPQPEPSLRTVPPGPVREEAFCINGSESTFDWEQKVKHLSGYPDCPSVSDWLWEQWTNWGADVESVFRILMKLYHPELRMEVIQDHIAQREKEAKALPAPSTEETSSGEHTPPDLVNPVGTGTTVMPNE